MTPHLKKRFPSAIFTIVLVLLSIAPAHAQGDSYTFLANTWEVVGVGRDYHRTSIAYYRVSVPEGGQTPMRALWAFSPDRQKAILDGFDWDNEAQLVRLSDDSIQMFQFEAWLSVPLTWSPDSKYLAVRVRSICACDSGKADLGIVDTDTGDLRVLTDGAFLPQDARPVAWSPDESRIAYFDQHYDSTAEQYVGTVKVISLDGSQPPRVLFSYTSPEEPYIPTLRWSSDGKHITLTILGIMSDIWLIAVQSGEVTFHYAAPQAMDACWSPQTDQLVLAPEAGFTWITLDGTTTDVSFIDPPMWQLQPGSTTPCAWSPDGTKLTLIYHQDYPTPPGIKIIDFNTRQVTDIQVEGNAVLFHPHWSLDSRLLALQSYEMSNDPHDIYVYDTTTMEQVMALQKMNFIEWLSAPSP